MWLSLSAANGYKDGSKARDIGVKQMSLAQIAEAQKLAQEWRAKHKKQRNSAMPPLMEGG